ncbi:histidinol-phosphate transaminase [Roseomonas sp. 18066]|uniref:pyridoxal phosphate-dependent aminotransferase n=1 Tax=Roseomonas sp. 18066 TaxID=2681412 RepID=UPI001358E15C|nr:histidinol-phosphate transaminase [Roseomonas sp. 18066]
MIGSAPPSLTRLVPEHVRRFTAYVPSPPDEELKRLYRIDHLHRLNNNENPLGPPPAAVAALAAMTPAQHALYPSGDGFFLRRRLAALHGVEPEQILIGNGANEVIAFVLKAFCQPGDAIVTADRTFAVYEWVAEFSGIEARLVPLRDHAFDDAAMLAAARADDRTKILFLCNPNNPTGSWWDGDRLGRFLDAVGGRQVVVVDEAYAEFVDDPAFPDAVALMRRHPNLVVFRTFSKMWGLAGLRIGYMIGTPEMTDIVRRTAVVYSVGGAAQIAALAAAGDQAHRTATNALMEEARRHVSAEMRGLGLPVLGRAGNFLMLRLPMSDTIAHRRLLAQGVMVRAMTGFRYPNHIRLSLSHPAAMEAFCRAMHGLVRR